MGHVIAPPIGSAALGTFGGLITMAPPESLPEGASPRNWDVDFKVGEVGTRPGLSSVYTFASSVQISAVTISSNVGTFTYLGKEPLPNEGLILSNFSGAASFLNGLTVVVSSATPTTFVAGPVPGSGTFINLSGIGTSTTGEFVGPFLGGLAFVVPSSGNPWANINGILSNISNATAITGASLSSTMAPGAAGNLSSTNPWANPSNLLSTSATTSVTLGPNSVSSPILANAMTFSLPADAVVTGITVFFKASTSGAAGSGAIVLQLATNGSPIGTPVTIPISSAVASYTAGSSLYQWGTVLEPDTVNGSAFGVVFQAAQGVGSGTFLANSLSVTVSYTTASSSEVLQVTEFNFVIPSTSGISGFGVTFQASTSNASSVTLQLLKNGLAVGTPKTQALTTIPTVYSLGAAGDLWGNTWLFSDVNNTQFGVQITSTGLGTTFINDLDMLTYLTPGLENFNYIKSFIQNDGQTDTLALDAAGILWEEDVTNNPGVLSIVLTGILPGSFAKSATADDQEYICFSNLSVGTERPRVYNGTQFLPLSQVGPGAPPNFVSQVGNSGTVLTVTDFVISGDVVTFTYSLGTQPTPGQIYSITGAVPTYLNFTGVILGTPAPSPTQFSMDLVAADQGTTAISPAANATLATSYGITSITQAVEPALDFDSILLSAGPGQTTPGSTLTVYYLSTIDQNLQNQVTAGNAVYVFLDIPGYQIVGTYLILTTGLANPPGQGHEKFYFTVNFGSTGYFYHPDHPVIGTYQLSLATLTVSSYIPNLTAGSLINITGATPSNWNGSWPIVSSLNSGILNITSTQMDATGTATYGYNVQSGASPINGQPVTITGATNNGIFNTTGVISNNVPNTSFQIAGFPAGASIPAASESAVGQTYGNQFTFDPGAKTLTTNVSPIYGDDTATGTVTTVGGSITPIGAGTRQAVVFFITESGYETQPSPPITFTTSQEANNIIVANIPLGPPNVVARGIAFTEAGQNGVPGANFYVIPNDVIIKVNNVTTTYTSTIIRDNVTTTGTFSFTDAVLLNSTEIDIQGNDLFNLIELGSSAWCVPYASRMFYGLQLNKVDNFLNLTFDGGYLPNPGGNLFPLGWTSESGGLNTNLITSPVTGQALYITNTTGTTLASAGLMSQPAYQDAYQVPIINANTLYSIRVACSCPSGNQVGTLVISLVTFNSNLGFGKVYGSFSVPLSSMSTNTQVFTGTLLNVPFILPQPPSKSPVPNTLALALQVVGLGNGSDCLIDRIEIFPTLQPYLLAQVYGSYVDNLEAIDASGSGGIVDTSSENPQSCMGGFVMHDTLYLLKTDSMVSTEDNPSSEPGGWSVHEVSNRVGAIGINAYDTGEEWCLTACRAGVYGFNGGSPTKISHEIYQIWDAINWYAGNTIVLRNDIVNKRILIAIPLPTGTSPEGVPTKTVQWLPFAPYNPAPTTPNVMLMCSYKGIDTFEELIGSPGMRTTMFGTLADRDMTRKWTIWQIPSPYMDFISRPDIEDKPLFVGNGINSSKIYQFLDEQRSDDGASIWSLYVSYGHVNAEKAATLPVFSFAQKRYTVLQGYTVGEGSMSVTVYQNTLGARYPYTIPGGVKLSPVMNDDWWRPLNIRAQRAFISWSTNAVGSWFQLSKSILSGKADDYSLSKTGGGNRGITS